VNARTITGRMMLDNYKIR